MRSLYNPASKISPFLYKTGEHLLLDIHHKEKTVKKDVKELLVLTAVLAAVVFWTIGISALVGLS